MLYWLANRREQRIIARLEREVASLNVLCGALIESHTRAIAAVEAEDLADVERRLRSIGPPPSDDDEGGDRPRPARARRDLER